MQPRGFAVNFTGSDAGTYNVYMAETVINQHLDGGATTLGAGASAFWNPSFWTLTITDANGSFNVYTAPAADGSVFPTNPTDWTLVTDGGNTDLAFTVYIP